MSLFLVGADRVSLFLVGADRVSLFLVGADRVSLFLVEADRVSLEGEAAVICFWKSDRTAISLYAGGGGGERGV